MKYILISICYLIVGTACGQESINVLSKETNFNKGSYHHIDTAIKIADEYYSNYTNLASPRLSYDKYSNYDEVDIFQTILEKENKIILSWASIVQLDSLNLMDNYLEKNQYETKIFYDSLKNIVRLEKGIHNSRIVNEKEDTVYTEVAANMETVIQEIRPHNDETKEYNDSIFSILKRENQNVKTISNIKEFYDKLVDRRIYDPSLTTFLDKNDKEMLYNVALFDHTESGVSFDKNSLYKYILLSKFYFTLYGSEERTPDRGISKLTIMLPLIDALGIDTSSYLDETQEPFFNSKTVLNSKFSTYYDGKPPSILLLPMYIDGSDNNYRFLRFDLSNDLELEEPDFLIYALLGKFLKEKYDEVLIKDLFETYNRRESNEFFFISFLNQYSTTKTTFKELSDEFAKWVNNFYSSN